MAMSSLGMRPCCARCAPRSGAGSQQLQMTNVMPVASFGATAPPERSSAPQRASANPVDPLEHQQRNQPALTNPESQLPNPGATYLPRPNSMPIPHATNAAGHQVAIKRPMLRLVQPRLLARNSRPTRIRISAATTLDFMRETG
ncbi:hypothetical protein XAP6164_4200005 [Xanthomonas phaseoli pv. phaseoli]|uniref:Uncharacterized protein n=1 Tax=Xanthomonas campestris pv. phaseoli TaxID=317013 RepID=A0AB38E983_XANCH|nr:hypothetical protein XAP7430_990009 [Xanthomonas phaseoli pv. phaseoli]SOO30250.1 hypothetical protein XAP6164_4200005 [Xanthomonas phaseoli pv. phaseoli]